jgi:translocation and assembly module TamB
VKKALKIFLRVLLGLLVFIILVLILVQTPPVQNFARKKVQAWLQKKLDTRFEIGKIYIGLPSSVVLERIYVEDKNKDTLLYGGSIRANISLFKLLKREVQINDLHVENLTANIKRVLPDTVYNFQFIVDAFTPKTPTPAVPADTAAMKLALDKLSLDNIRFRYDDTVTGNNWSIVLRHFDTRIKTFDPQKLVFDIGNISIDGLTARMYQYKPLVEPADITNDTETAAPMPLISLASLDLENIDVDYRNQVSAFYAQAKLGNLDAEPKEFNLAQQRITLDKIQLDEADIRILMGKSGASKLVEKKVGKEAKEVVQENWRITVADLELNKSFFKLDNDNYPRQPHGVIDYAHLDADNITLHAEDMFFNGDTIAANLQQGKLTEQSGFVLQQLRGNVLYTPTGAHLDELLVQTTGTRIQHTIHIDYPSLESLQTHIENMQVNAELSDCYISTKDILYFAPDLRKQPLFANPAAVFRIDGKVSGRVDNLVADNLRVEALSNTKIDVAGTISGLPDMNNLRGDIRIRQLQTSRKDLAAFLPASLFQTYEFPSMINVRGTVKAGPQQAIADLDMRTSSGNLTAKGIVRNYKDNRAATYSAHITTTQLQVGKLIKNDSLQNLTASFELQGKGFTPQTADAVLSGNIQSFGFRRYNYNNVRVDATVKNQQAHARLGMMDPNIHFAANLTANFSKDDSSITAQLDIDSIKTQQLHLTPDAYIYRGKIMAVINNPNPDALDGKVDIIHSLLVSEDKRLQLDTVRFLAVHKGDSSRITLRSDIANARLVGKFRLTEIGTVFQQAIQPYFAVMPAKQADSLHPYSFSVGLYVDDNPAIKVFVPSLERLEEFRLNGRFVSDSGWSLRASSPLILMGTMRIDNLEFDAGVRQNALAATATVQQFKLGGNTMYNFALRTTTANNQLNFITRFDDRMGKEKYVLAGLIQQPQPDTYVFSLKPDSLRLNYEAWTIAANNSIRIANNNLYISNFVLSQNNQQFGIQSTANTADAPLKATFTNFQVATLAAFVQPDSLTVNGAISGGLELRHVMTQPSFSGDLTINNLSFRKDTVGDVRIRANNNDPDRVAADIVISGRGNDVTLRGDYYVRPVNGHDFNMTLNIARLNMASIQGATMGAISNASGDVSGRFAVTGTVSQPVVEGQLAMKQTAFNLTMLNSYFKIDNETIAINREGIRFDRFEIADSINNKAIINGMVYTTNFTQYRFDLTMRANEFRALNTTKKDNQLYYGTLYFSSNITIKGTDQLPIVDGNITINDKTDITVVLPTEEPAVVQREGIIQFIDMDAPENDSLFLDGIARLDSLNKSALRGLDVSANLEIKKEAVFNLVIDAGNGDFLRMKGEGLLTGGIDQSGKVTLAGSYEIQEGAYELTFNLLRRKFNIQQGSKIVWNGEPTKADVNITAVYVSNAAPLDLVKDQLGNLEGAQRNIYLQRLPFEVNLQMQGELLQPKITFDIKLPEDKNYGVAKEIITNSNTRLEQLRQEPSEMNKQVFALLLLNRFITENPLESSTGLSAETLARQSASRLLTEQLNQLAAGLIHGVDINFDLTSMDDYSTGTKQTRTDLNVGLSKRLLNDRLTVSVGSNFELEGQQNTNRSSSNLAGNISIGYQLSKDGRYMIRAYRKNEYEGIIDGYIVETGVGFIITVDYNRFRNIFMSQKQRQERRKQREAAREQQQNAEATEERKNRQGT